MFTFDLQRFDSVIDNDYNLKQGLRNIITSLNSKIEGEYVMASNANMTIDDVVDAIINALQSGATPTTAKLEPALYFNEFGWSYDSSRRAYYKEFTYNGDGVVVAYISNENYGRTVGNGTYCAINRNTNRVYLEQNNSSDVVISVAYYIQLHATEGEHYAAKTITEEDSE